MKKTAFSLIELLISLIIISVITAAFAPIMTKRLDKKKSSLVNKISTNCPSNCKLCYNQSGAKKCLICSLSCPSGQYTDNDSCTCKTCAELFGANCAACSLHACLKCKPGFGLNSSSNSCTGCGAGTYSNGSMDCKPCPVGQYQDGGQQSSCKLCPAGYYQPNRGQTACAGAPAGHYQDATGQASYKPCPVGHYQPYAAQASCPPCPAGHYQPYQGQTGCAACGVGTVAQSGASACVTCGPGTYQPYQGQATCHSCPPGEYCPGGASVAWCPAGYYAVGGASSCSPCRAGEYQPYPGRSNCYVCPAGSTSGEGAAGCSCNPGYINLGAGCQPCSLYFGAHCAACTSTTCTSCTNGAGVHKNGRCLRRPASQADCNDKQNFLYSYINGGICIDTAYRGADFTNGKAGVTLVQAGTYCNGVGGAACCWYGGGTSSTNTAGDGCTVGVHCNHAVCTYAAAVAICNERAYSRPATQGEISSLWRSLNICYQGYCPGVANCIGAKENKCDPYGINGYGGGAGCSYNTGGFSCGGMASTKAYGVRCVREWVVE